MSLSKLEDKIIQTFTPMWELNDRAIKYRQDRFKHMSHKEMEADAIQHIKDKYGHGGYARYPAIYVSAYGEEFKRLKDAIALL